MILPYLDEDQAGDWIAETLATIRSHDWSPLTEHLPVTASVGLSTARGSDWTRERLLREADEHLYSAKHTGRDRYVGPSRSALA